MGKVKELCTCTRLQWEINDRSWYGIEEPNGDSINVEQSFSRRDYKIPLLVTRLFILSWSASAFTSHLLRYPRENIGIFFGYYNHWVWMTALLYQFFVLCLTIFQRCNFAKQPPEGDAPYYFIRLIWTLYELSVTNAFLLILLFYIPELTRDRYHDDNSYLNVFLHTILCGLLLVDGAILARIPVKLKHFVFVFLYLVCFMIWSVVHDLTGIGNGSWTSSIEENEDIVGRHLRSLQQNSTVMDMMNMTNTNTTMISNENNDDDALYPFMSWKDKPGTTTLFYFLTLFIVSPLCYVVIWLTSIKPRPIYGGLNDLNGSM